MFIKKNDVLRLEVQGLTSEGNGVAKKDDFPIFIPNSAVGDILDVRIVKVLKKYAFGKIEKIIDASSTRVSPDCNEFLKCGGCVYRHISYDAEIKAKQQKVRDAVRRIGGFENLTVNDIVGSPIIDHYRNKAQIPVGRDAEGNLCVGFFAPHSHRIINCDNCLLQPEAFNDVIDAFKKWVDECNPSFYDESLHIGLVRHLYIRIAEATGELMVCIVANGKSLPGESILVEFMRNQLPNIKSIVLNVNTDKTNVIMGKQCRTIWGSDYITDTLCGLNFNISPLSFYQVNRIQAEKLYCIAKKYAGLDSQTVLLDLYCGTGTIGLTMAKNVEKLIGVEVVEQAVIDAKKNAKINGINNAEFICSDASKAADLLLNRGERPNVVIIDPPRKGCDSELIKTISVMGPSRVVYVSCDPATLARDLKLFNSFGYTPKEITPVDLFPRTSHVETVCLLSKIG